MKLGRSGRAQAWLKRRTLRFEDLREWDADDWEQWWTDGLDVWFSEFGIVDREQAFAPLRLNAERERPAERVPSFLSRFYDSSLAADAASAMALQDAIEEGAIRVANTRGILNEVRRGALLVRVFSLLQARRTEELVSSIVAAAAKRWFGDTALDELLSALTRPVGEMVAVERLSDEVRTHFETVLRGQANFRPLIIYAIRRYPKDPAACLSTFDDLWCGRQSMEEEATWRAIGIELDKHYGRDKVVAALRRLAPKSFAAVKDASGWAFLPAQGLKSFYPELFRADRRSGSQIVKGVWDLIKDSQAMVVDATRGLTTVSQNG